MMMEHTTVENYLNQLPEETKGKLDLIRTIIKNVAPEALEVVSYGVVGYKLPPGDKRGFVFVGGYDKHIGLYPVPAVDEELAKVLKPYIAGKGTLRFQLDENVPGELIERVVRELYQQAKQRNNKALA